MSSNNCLHSSRRLFFFKIKPTVETVGFYAHFMVLIKPHESQLIQIGCFKRFSSYSPTYLFC